MSLEKVGTGWSLVGDEDTDTTINFIGTVDAKDFIVKTNNLERMRVASDGSIGINKSAPSELIDIEDTSTGTAVIRLQHTVSNKDARLEIRTMGGGDADPFIRLAIDGATSWSFGIDDSDSDSFKIANFTSPGNNARIKIEKDGKVFINRNLEVGSTQTEDMVQVQILAGASQSVNILQIGENSGGALDKFFVVDEVGRIGIGTSVNPAARLNVVGGSDEIQTLIKGNSTQTSNILEVQDSAAATLFTVANSGDTVVTGDLEADSRDVLRYAFFLGG